VREVADLRRLWVGRMQPLLKPPIRPPHPFTPTIEEVYRWKEPGVDEAAVAEPLIAEPAVADAPEQAVEREEPR
ncbi:MAG: hypothetical protein M3T56_05310, partial [Chloroflexota bacterium]|nr:hypothetical protein [Chloroflexota bacterium]